MIRRLAGTGMVKTISVARGIGIDRLPLTVAHQIRVHVKGRHIDVRGLGITLAIQIVAHDERTSRNERRAIGGDFKFKILDSSHWVSRELVASGQALRRHHRGRFLSE